MVFIMNRPPHNLHLIDEMDSMSPIMDIKVADLCREHTPQIYAVTYTNTYLTAGTVIHFSIPFT
jgi:hypothetical protein